MRTELLGIFWFVGYSLVVYALARYIGPLASLSFVALTILANQYWRAGNIKTIGKGNADADAEDYVATVHERESLRQRRLPPVIIADPSPPPSALPSALPSPPAVLESESDDKKTAVNEAFGDMIAADVDGDADGEDDAFRLTSERDAANATVAAVAAAGVPSRQRKNTIPMDGDYVEFLEDLRDKPRSIGLRRGEDVLLAGNERSRQARMRDVIERKTGYTCPNERLAKLHQRKLDMRLAIRANARTNNR